MDAILINDINIYSLVLMTLLLNLIVSFSNLKDFNHKNSNSKKIIFLENLYFIFKSQ
jgi:hypothetical protein